MKRLTNSPAAGRLCLTRRANEAIELTTADGPVWIRITQIAGKNVRLSIEAPRTVNVRRGELAPRAA